MEKIQFKKTYVGFLYDDEEDNKIIKSMGGTFNEAFAFLYDYYEMPSDSFCAKLCGVSKNTIASYYNGTAKEPGYKRVLAICCGFNLRPRVSKRLLATIRVDLALSMLPQDHLYLELVNNCYDEGIEEWNQHIIESEIGSEHLL